MFIKEVSVALPREEYMLNARNWLVENIVNGNLKRAQQVSAAVEHIKKLKLKHKTSEMMPLDAAEAARASGIGIELSEADVKKRVGELLAEHKAGLLEDRYRYFKEKVIRVVSEDLKWADGAMRTRLLNEAVAALLGPETEEDKKPKKKPAAAAPAAAAAAAAPAAAAAGPAAADAKAGDVDSFLIGREIPDAVNTPFQLKLKTDAVGDTVFTRFPPEPNGYLHLGHAKSINFNFGVARRFNGKTVLRFDDTNPDAEEQEFIDMIIKTVEWLGFQPCSVNFSSDYFPALYDLAIKLIKAGHAYVCHQTPEQIKKSR